MYASLPPSFNSEMDLLKQYNGDNEYNNGGKSKIIKLPWSYLRYVLKSVYHEERTVTYIGNGLGKEAWLYQHLSIP